MTVAELNKKVDILEKIVVNLEKMVINDGEMIKIQQKAIDNLDKRMDLLAGAEFKTNNIKIKNGDETITISKREFLEKCAKMMEEGNIADSLGSAMYAALIAFELFDKDKEEK